MDILQWRGVDLEVEGVRYIEMHRGPHTCWAYGKLATNLGAKQAPKMLRYW